MGHIFHLPKGIACRIYIQHGFQTTSEKRLGVIGSYAVHYEVIAESSHLVVFHLSFPHAIIVLLKYHGLSKGHYVASDAYSFSIGGIKTENNTVVGVYSHRVQRVVGGWSALKLCLSTTVAMRR